MSNLLISLELHRSPIFLSDFGLFTTFQITTSNFHHISRLFVGCWIYLMCYFVIVLWQNQTANHLPPTLLKMKAVKAKSTEDYKSILLPKTFNSSLLLSKRERWQKAAAHAKSLSLYFCSKFTSLHQTAHCGAITLNLIQQILSIKLLLGLTLFNNEEDVEILKWNAFFIDWIKTTDSLEPIPATSLDRSTVFEWCNTQS